MNGTPPPMTMSRGIGPLLVALKLAEEISRDVSLRQAAIAPNAQLRRGLQQQSRQEALHATAFEAALKFGPQRAQCPPGLIKALNAFSAQLHADLDAGALATSMVGLQCVFEGLGCIALRPCSGELLRLSDRLVPLRPLFLLQEQAHHRLGELWVPRLAGGSASPGCAELNAARHTYVELAEAVVDAGLFAVAGCENERQHYLEATQTHLLKCMSQVINRKEGNESLAHQPEK